MTNCEQSLKIEKFVTKQDNIYGLIIAIFIITLWAISLVFLLNLNITQVPIWSIPIGIMAQMFLFTGLFITAHDAMHGSVYPQNLKINHFIGGLTVFFYNYFSYKDLLHKHWLHHRHPASEIDPDYHDGKRSNGIFWYIHFMQGYWGWNNFIGATIAFFSTKYIWHISEINFFVFWIFPLVLSSFQLFYFGTYLPHKQPSNGYTSHHCAQTIALPVFWSFIACYHFGYHGEHHEYPHVPWWQLPEVYKQRQLQVFQP